MMESDPHTIQSGSGCAEIISNLEKFSEPTYVTNRKIVAAISSR